MIKIFKSDEFNARYAARDDSSEAARARITGAVAEIIADVRKRGDAALREYTERFDGCVLDRFELPYAELEKAACEVDADFVEVMRRAAKNIEDFHRRQIRRGYEITGEKGVILGQRILPLARVGIYIPGGTAPYPSTVLMNVIPAKLAGVGEIIIATPPSKDGGVDTAILAAAKIAGADRVFTIGGAQAIAALAYGTESIPKVDKITGPGNAYVAEAKRQVFGAVGIDMLAGPSDILIIAGENADAALIAADMLSQCEHGADSPAVLVTVSETLAERVCAEIEQQIKELTREAIAREAINNHGRIIVAKSLEQAFDITNDLAPEHLEIFLDDPYSYLSKVTNAGSVFLGKHTPEALSDYFAGPNHTLPTSGTARFSSPLSVDDFVKKSSYTYYTGEALNAVAADVVCFAEKEGLDAHAKSVLKRMQDV